MSGFDWDAHPVVGQPQAQAKAPPFDWDAHPVVGAPSAEAPSTGIVDTVVNGLVKTGKAIDSVTGAPTRAAIAAAQNGNNPIPAFTGQFAEDPDKAPTGKDIALKAGLSDKHAVAMTAEQQRAFDEQNDRTFAGPKPARGPYKDLVSWSPADVGGAAITAAADPTLAIPVIGESKIGAKLLKGGGELVGKAGEGLNNLAEKFAVNATGATGKQAAKFSDTAGRELLDRGIVQFGDSQSKIADRASQALDAANTQIDTALSKLEAQGVKVDTVQVKRELVDKVRDLAADSSQHDVLKLINNEIKNITDAAQARGTTELGISAAEKTKRGYSKAAGNWMDPKAGQAGKETYLSFRDAVENAATAADPEAAALFKEGKETHGLLAPIQEAAERRALTTGQHPAGGFLDMASTAVGEGAAGLPGAIAMPVARRVISPRIASTLAVTSDKLGDILKGVPELKNLQTEQPVLYQALLSHLAGPAQQSLKVADDNSKGPAKWANDGAEKLITHSPDDKQTIEKARGAANDDPKVKALLIQASDLKPGSAAMQKTIEKLKSKLASGDE